MKFNKVEMFVSCIRHPGEFPIGAELCFGSFLLLCDMHLVKTKENFIELKSVKHVIMHQFEMLRVELFYSNFVI